MTELYNILLTAIFGMVILLTLLKLSLYRAKWKMMAGLAWGVVTYLTVMSLSSTNNLLQSPEARYGSLTLWLFMDCMMFVGFSVIRAGGRQNSLFGKILWFYPGVSPMLPLTTCATCAIISFPGIDFGLLALISGIVVALALISLSLVIGRNLPSGKIISAIYYCAIASFIICVIFCGIQ